MLESGAIEPEDAGLLCRRFDFGREAQQTLSQIGERFFTLGRRNFAGAQRGS